MKQKILSVAMICILLLSGCTGMFSSESFFSIIGCIFYGDCNYSRGYYDFVVFEGAADQPAQTLVGNWTHRSDTADGYYILNLKADNSLTLQYHFNNPNRVNRSDQGRYVVTDDIITITMVNGTQSVVTVIREDNKLYMALAELP